MARAKKKPGSTIRKRATGKTSFDLTKERCPEGIRILKIKPRGYISQNEFARRAECQASTILRARKTGKIDIEYVRWVITPDCTVPTVYYSWKMACIEWIVSRGPENWPEGFTPPEDEPIEQDGEVRKSNLMDLRKDAPLTNINEVKLKKELLAIEQKELELRIRRNETIEMEAVIDILTAVATETKAGLKVIRSKNKKLLAAEHDSFEVDRILEDEFDRLITKMDEAFVTFINGDEEYQGPDMEQWEKDMVEESKPQTPKKKPAKKKTTKKVKK